MKTTNQYDASAPSYPAPSLIPAVAAQTKCRVLVIDDCPDMIHLLNSYLTDPRIRVTIARNGLEGLAAFREGIFDLVLMDMEMPEMNGYAATISIRTWEADRQLPRTPIAALTAVSDFGASNRILLAGCTLHLTKPIMRETLLQIVSQFGTARHGAH
jgi:CheY-like chemotaxis protein